MPDYFKEAFPAGMSFERRFTFEDGGVVTACGNIWYKSDEEYRIDTILFKINLQGHFLYGEGSALFESVTKL